MFSRIFWIARVTFLEALRQRFLAFLLLLAAAFILGSVPLRSIDFGHGELKFLADLGFGALFLFGSILAVVLPAQLLYGEIDNRTALTLLAKPVGRGEFLLGKFFGSWAVLGVFTFALTGLIGIILLVREPDVVARAMALQVVPPEVSVVGLFEHALLQWLRLGIIVSLALLVGSLAQTFLYTVVVGSMAVLASQLVWIAQDTLANPEAVLSTLMRGALWLTTRLFPNLQGYNIGETLVLAQSTVLPGTVSSLCLSAAVYLVLILFLACTAFRRREI
jgi:ABC-type transport system involved in multi-copper enzyme maturation permease subunit